MTTIKAAAFDWVFKSLIALAVYMIMQMNGSIERLTVEFTKMRTELDILQDRQLNLRFQMIPPAKHEDIQTLDSLIKSE